MAARARARPEFKPQRDAEFSTISGHPVEPLYSPQDAPVDPDATIGSPGEYPFTRGPYRSMYRGRLWTMRQFAGFGTVEETNAASTTSLTTVRQGSRPPSTCRR